MLVFKMCGIAFFRDLVHSFASDLYLYPTALGPHYCNMERLVARRFWGRYPIPKTNGVRGKVIGNDGINFPCDELFVLTVCLVDYPEGELVVYLIEGYILDLHFPTDGKY